MHDAELKRMRELIRTRQYVMTLHAEDEMDADGLTTSLSFVSRECL